ncbi:MAG: type II secretion system protein [Phycisphaerales bacterium]|nr:type II secretion system protein [Phycisphaerales bacterium]
MHTRTSHPKRLGKPASDGRAFTLLELVVVIAIIVLMITFLASALGRASTSARQTASQRSAEAIAVSVEHFRIQFGFLPPLVHDGEIISTGDSDYNPVQPDGSPYPDGPTQRHSETYEYSTLIVWSEGTDFNFFRRRDGGANDEVDSVGGGVWDIESAWDDRRYSRYALAYYLAGVLPRSVDGIAGQGMSRPLSNGGFANVGYPVGSTRERYQPTIDTNRDGIDVRTGYARPIEVAEHNPGAVDLDALSPDMVYDLYADEDQDRLVALIDNFGTAYRYYRWEPGRYDEGRRLVIESTLDLNIPPILLDPLVLVELKNNDANAKEYDLTNGNLELRNARFAIVGAGADGLFGTEPVEYLVSQLSRSDPAGDETEIARLRQKAMDDNVIALGK